MESDSKEAYNTSTMSQIMDLIKVIKFLVLRLKTIRRFLTSVSLQKLKSLMPYKDTLCKVLELCIKNADNEIKVGWHAPKVASLFQL